MNGAVAINARIFTFIISSFCFSLLHNNLGFNPKRDGKFFTSKFNGMNSITMISNQINIINNNI
jgi:membrane protease YdiL (CAAX protease family)